jgi:hypothetical protein
MARVRTGTIAGNSGEKPNCSDIDPAPTGSCTSISELADGRSAGF